VAGSCGDNESSDSINMDNFLNSVRLVDCSENILCQ
jgi:hypothetical protein